jgi:hypothetical protein
VAVAGGEPQQVGDQGDLVAALRRPREQRLELAAPGLRRVLPREPGRPLELTDHREQRAVPVLRRAEVAEFGVRLLGEPLHQPSGEPGLADAGFTREQDHPALAAFRLRPAAPQQLDLLVPADQRRAAGGRVQRLGVASERGRTEHPPGPHRRGEALRRDGAELAALEQPAEAAPRAGVDHHGVRFGQGLQPGGAVRCLADRAALAHPGGVADHHHSGGDADPGLERRAVRRREPADRLDQIEPGGDRALGVVLVRPGPAEVGQHAVAHVAGHVAAVARDRPGGGLVVGRDDVPQILGIEP